MSGQGSCQPRAAWATGDAIPPLRQQDAGARLVIGGRNESADGILDGLRVEPLGGEFQPDRRRGVALPRPVVGPEAHPGSVIQHASGSVRAHEARGVPGRHAVLAQAAHDFMGRTNARAQIPEEYRGGTRLIPRI